MASTAARAILSHSNGLVLGLLGLAAVGLTAAEQGAYFPPAWGWSSLGLLLALTGGLLFRDRIGIAPAGVAMVAGLLSLLLWIALSTTWSASSPSTVDELERAIIYVAAVGAVLVLSTHASGPYLLGGVLTSVAAVSAYSLVQNTGGPEDHPLGGPVGYWNALGILAAIGVILALGFLTARVGLWLRIAACAFLPVFGATLYLTRSRGALVALAAGVVVFVLLGPLHERRIRRATAMGVATLALAGLAVGLVSAGGPSRLLDTGFDAFRSAPAANGARSERLLTLSGNSRSAYWRVAWREYSAHPVLGSGAGTFEFYWNRDRDTIYGARDAHSLYLEALAELGPIGLLLLLTTLAVPLVALPAVRDLPLVAAAAGGYVTFLVHAGIDWDWEMPAVTLAGLFCGAAIVVASPSSRRFLSSTARASTFAAVLVLAGFSLAAYRGNSANEASVEAAGRGDFVRARTTARTATRWTPWSSEAWRLLGEADLALGRSEAARASFRTAIAKDPRAWRLWYDLALASTGAARERAIAEAARLNRLSLEVRALQGK